jgi:predicted Zn-dependent protease
VDFGPPVAFKPARELEGEILLDMGRAEDALSVFEMALDRTPNRILSLAGYAKAAATAGRMDIASNAYRVLADLLTGADAEMLEARAARAFLPN